MSAGNDVELDEPSRERPRSDAAIAAHKARMRPLTRIYAIAVTVVVVAAVAFFVVEYERGEISHASLHPIGTPPPSVTLKAPASSLTKAWANNDTAAVGAPYFDGTVVTHDAHTVRGRNVLTGAQTWSYTRTDRTVCAAVQNDGVTIAVYREKGACDELTAVDTGTGQRRWTRTLDENGAVFEGPVSYWTQPGNVLFVSRTSVYSIADENATGEDWWTFYHPGCTIDDAMLGVGGALISQTCHGEDCAQRHFCGDGQQLLLRQGEASYNDDSDTNPDRILWNRRNTSLQPVLVGQHVAARNPDTGAITVLNQKSGRPERRVNIPASTGTAPLPDPSFTSTIDGDMLWQDGHTYTLETGAEIVFWQARTDALPSVTVAAGNKAATFGNGRFVAATGGSRIVELDGHTGRVTRSYQVGRLPAGSRVFPVGAGFLVAGSSVSYYR